MDRTQTFQYKSSTSGVKNGCPNAYIDAYAVATQALADLSFDALAIIHEVRAIALKHHAEWYPSVEICPLFFAFVYHYNHTLNSLRPFERSILQNLQGSLYRNFENSLNGSWTDGKTPSWKKEARR